VDEQGRYRQVLGAYHREEAPIAFSAPVRSAYIRIIDRSRRNHDGLYFRIAFGIGSGHDAMRSSIPLPTQREVPFQPDPLDGSGSGLAAATELAVGFTPFRGVVLGVGSFTATIPTLVAAVQDSRTGGYRFRLSQFAMIGPLLDWYVDAGSGFHVEASPGLASYVAGAGEPRIGGAQAQAHTAAGFGFMLGAGYEWWIGDQWSVGLLGRITYGAMSGTDDRGVSWTHHAVAPAVLLGGTYH
jgi:hypothetical protein